jgi:hypothetical protein
MARHLLAEDIICRCKNQSALWILVKLEIYNRKGRGR